MMRLFVFLLAMLTGFSAAHAAQMESKAPSTFHAAVSIADNVLCDTEAGEGSLAVADTGIKRTERELVRPVAETGPVSSPTVYRGDRAHE